MSEPKSETKAAPSTPGELAGQNGAAPAKSTATRNDNPYVGPRSIEAGEEIYGRKREKSKLFDRLIAERIVLLHSPSGAGKSSLINAALLPLLRAEGFAVLPIMRVSGDKQVHGANRYVLNALQCLEKNSPDPKLFPNAKRLSPEELATLTLDDYLTQRALIESAPAGAPEQAANERYEVLIFDQFEEILTQDATDKDVKDEFFKQVGKALQKRHRWALFVVREDYLGALEPYAGLVPTRMGNRFRLDLLNLDAAREAIQKPALQHGVRFSDAAADKLIKELAKIKVPGPNDTNEKAPEITGLYVEPVQLQVVCQRLWNDLPRGTTEISEEQIGQVSNVDKALANYYDDTVKAVAEKHGVAERAIRKWFDRELITRGGIRSQAMQPPNDTREGINNSKEKEAADDLVESHLVREEERRGLRWYELAHDRLVHPVRESNKLWFQNPENMALAQSQAEAWKDQDKAAHLLLRGREWKEVERWAAKQPMVEVKGKRQRDITPDEMDFIAKCRGEIRSRQRIAYLSGLVLLVSVFIFWRQINGFYNSKALRLHGLYQQLAAQSQLERPQRADLALLLGLESLHFADEASNAVATHWFDVKRKDAGGAFEARSALLAGLSQSPQLMKFLRGPSDRVWHVAVSAKGHFVAATDDDDKDGNLWLWDTVRNTRGVKLASKIPAVRSLAFSPDGKTLAMGDKAGGLVLWDCAAGSKLAARLVGVSAKVEIKTVAFVTNEKLVVVAKDSQSLIVQRFATKGAGLLRHLDERKNPIVKLPPAASVDLTTLALNADSSQLATANRGEQPSITVWNTETGQKLQTRDDLPKDSYVNHVAFKGNGPLLAFALSDAGQNKIVVWNTKEKPMAPKKKFPGELVDSTTYWLAFSPDGKTLASAHADGHLMLMEWNEKTQRFHDAQKLVGHRETVTNVAFSSDGGTAASASWDGTVILWDNTGERSFGRRLALPPMPQVKSGVAPEKYNGWVYNVVFEGNTLRACDVNRRVTSWNLDAPVAPQTELPVTTGVNNLVCSADGQWRAWRHNTNGNHDDGALEVQSLASPKPYRLPFKHKDDPDGAGVNSFAFSPRAALMATGGEGNDLILWDLKAGLGQKLHKLAGEDALEKHHARVSSVAFSPDGKWLASGDVSGKVLCWEVDSGKLRDRCHTKYKQRIHSLAVNRDGNTVAIGNDDFTVSLWKPNLSPDLSPDQVITKNLRVLGTHGHWVTSVAFSPDGTMLASGSVDKTIILWDIARQEKLSSLVGHTDQVSSVAFSANGKWLASASADGSVRLWDMDQKSWKDRACDLVNRNLTDAEQQRYIGDDQDYLGTCPGLPPGR